MAEDDDIARLLVAEGRRQRGHSDASRAAPSVPRAASARVAKRLISNATRPERTIRKSTNAAGTGQPACHGAVGGAVVGRSQAPDEAPRWVCKGMRVRRVGHGEPALVSAARQRGAIILRRTEGDSITASEDDLLPVLPVVGGLARLLAGGELVELVALGEGRRATVRLPPRGSVLCEVSAWDICEVVSAPRPTSCLLDATPIRS